MIPQNNLLTGLASLLGLGLIVYMWIVVIRAVITWVNPNPRNPLVQFLARITDPPLYYIRRSRLPVWFAGIDFSPLVLILLLVFLNDFLVRGLKLFGQGASVDILLPLFLVSLLSLARTVLFLYLIVIIVRAVISWISPDPYNPIVRVIYAMTEPLLHRLRRTLPLAYGGFDLSPVLALAGIYLLMHLVDLLMAQSVGIGRGGLF